MPRSDREQRDEDEFQALYGPWAPDITDVTFIGDDGIRYLLPEIAISYKAALNRPKDDLDLTATLAVLEPAGWAWLRDAVTRQAPDHPWLDRI